MPVGRPDYYSMIQPSRTILAPNQFWYKLTALASGVPAGGSAYLEITVPTYYRMYLSVLEVNCSASCIQRITVAENGVVMFNGKYDIVGKFYMPDLAADVYPAGTVIRITVYNDDIVARDFFINLKWILERTG